MDRSSSQRAPRTDETRSVFSSIDNCCAESIQLLLLALDIRAVVRQRDPFATGMVAFEVLVMSVDHLKAQQALQESRSSSQGDDWQCPACHEPVPGNFDICWNCETVHPDLAIADDRVVDVEESVQAAKVGNWGAGE